jgi:hypothetical protein
VSAETANKFTHDTVNQTNIVYKHLNGDECFKTCTTGFVLGSWEVGAAATGTK